MTYYDVNVQIWAEDGEYYYSVIQEFNESGSNQDVLAYGTTDSLEDAIKTARQAILEVLS